MEKLTPEDQNLIGKYLDNDLSQDQLITFRQKFETNPKFAREVKLYTDIRIALKSASKFRLQTGSERKVIRFSIVKLALAASVALLIGLGGLYLILNQGNTLNRKLYSESFYNPLERNDSLIHRTRGEDIEPVVVEKFMTAITFMENKQFTNAVSIFEALLGCRDEKLNDEIEWYLSLCYLRIGKTHDAVELFIKILNSNSVHNEEARILFYKLAEK
ncbi:MAG: hypothetical protein U1C46_01620 [Bacteroidales bacterium]|nr:hypothetical protein [Bacteroidales bacterium]